MAFSVVSFSIANIFRARQPSAFVRVSTVLNAPGSRARGPVVFGLRPIVPPIDSAPETVAAYIAAEAQTAKPSTISRRVAAIRYAVAAKMLGMVATAPDKLAGLRDRALLLIGLVALRRSELVALGRFSCFQGPFRCSQPVEETR
jgi:hypothetical protein